MVMHKYTKQEDEFFREYVPGHSVKEITEEFNRRFDWEITEGRVKAYMKNHNLKNGRDCRFTKGQESWNKGKKGVVFPGSEKGWFKAGNIPLNHRPVGSERIDTDGYVMVKVAEPNKWKLKHRLVYEQYYGEIPCGVAIIFLDGNKLNLDINNLKAIKRSTLAVLNNHIKLTDNAEMNEIKSNLAELQVVTSKVKRKEK